MSDEGVVPLTYLYTVRLCDHILNMNSKQTVLTFKLIFCEPHTNNVEAQFFNIGNMIYQPTLVKNVNFTDR